MTVSLGALVVDRDQPPLSSEEAKVVDRFHERYYRQLAGRSRHHQFELVRPRTGEMPT